MAEHRTLLDIAKEVPPSRVTLSFSDEEVELALAWARGAVTHSQVARVRNVAASGSYCFLARALAQYISKAEGRNG